MQASERAATPPVTGTRSALARVRLETRELHEQIEGAVPLLRPGAAAGTYRWYLQKLLGYHRPLERVLFSMPGLAALGLRRHEREKGPSLERDLQALGLSREQLGQLPDCSVLPEVAGVPAALGCAYVLEGATLGAQLLCRELGQRLPELMTCASGYLRCYGAHTGARWRAFTSALEQGAPDEAAQRALVASARATFASLHGWLTQGPPAPLGDSLQTERGGHG